MAQMFISRRARGGDVDVLGLSRQGAASATRDLAGGNVIQVERVYDASQRKTYHQVVLYAFGHNTAGEPLEGVERFLALPEMYFKFVSYSVLKDLFATYSRRMEETRKEQVST